MTLATQLVSVFLISVGIAGYVLSGLESPTALIPAGFGFVLSLLGYYGRHEQTHKTAMYMAMTVALIGVIGSAGGLASIPTLLSGADIVRPLAVISRSLMAVVLIAYLIRGVLFLRRG
jgi:hypothetical protein